MKIVVNADDFGMSHSKNLAIDNLMRAGICSNASLVVNMPYTEEAVKMALKGGYADKISLHLNMTEGKAVSSKIKSVSLYYKELEFNYKPIIKNINQIMPWYITEIRDEISAQIETFIGYGFELKSLDSHNWIHLRLPIWIALRPLINKYRIKIIRPMWEGYKLAEIASKKWSKYFKLFQPILLSCKQCRIIEYSSNIEQFVLRERKLIKKQFVEVFTHPDLVDGKIMDLSSSYLKKERDTVENNVKLLKNYTIISVKDLIGEYEG